MQELRETIICGLPPSVPKDDGEVDSRRAVIARTGFFVLSSVFKERPRSRKPEWPELDTLSGSHQIK
jgi:hypothetical protein